MYRSSTYNQTSADISVGATTPPASRETAADQPGQRLRFLAALSGIVGPVLLIAYFITPLLVSWPSTAESPAKVAAYASAHRALFYLGGWLQTTGALLSVVFLLVLLQHSGARRTLAGSATIIGCAVLLSVVAVEAVMLEAVAVGAANGDHATVATGFQLASGVFARIFPLAPAPLVFAGIGFALFGTTILPRVFAGAAVAISGLFLISGLAAVFGSGGLIFATVMSVVEAIWIPAAAIAYARTSARARHRELSSPASWSG
ncbi:MAG: hypothetical protein J2P28_01450 [Actinobacteria bacterium]|nr:hypothetical protein [Actinomycetota bacterium]